MMVPIAFNDVERAGLTVIGYRLRPIFPNWDREKRERRVGVRRAAPDLIGRGEVKRVELVDCKCVLALDDLYAAHFR